MDHLTRCILFTLCGIPLALGGGMMAVGGHRNAPGQKHTGVALASLSGVGYLVFGAGLLFSLRLGYLLSGLLISLSLAAVTTALHSSIGKTVSSGFLRVLRRILLTVVQLVLYVVCLRKVGEKEKLVGVVMALGATALLGLDWLANERMWRRRRARKLVNSPVMVQVMELVKSRSCVAVQILPDRVRLFDRLPNTDFCKGEDYKAPAPSFTPPAHWAPWFRSGAWCHEVLFSAHDYPALDQEQVELCALGLRKKLPGFLSCHHHSSHSQTSKAVYNEERKAYVRTTYITHLYDDWLLFHQPTCKAMLRAMREEEKRHRTEAKAAPRGNSWE